jgi:hypothetical protein
MTYLPPQAGPYPKRKSGKDPTPALGRQHPTRNRPLNQVAIDLHRLHGFSLWDALVLRAANESACTMLYSEDLQPSRVIDGVQIVNPFV